MSIPKVIHQIWFQGEEKIPEHLQIYHKSWIDKNPSFEVKVWDEISIQAVLKEYNDTKTTEMYNNYRYMIQKIDLAKYIILYIYGGIYIDMDIKCIQPITDDFIKGNDVILSEMVYNIFHSLLFTTVGHTFTDTIINNGVIMVIPKHPILLYTIEEANNKKESFYYYVNKPIYVFSSTGPICLTLATKKYKSENKDTNIKILDKTYFEGCDLIQVNNNTCNIPSNAIGIHLYENSWLDSSDNVFVAIVSFLMKYMYFIFAFIVLFIGFVLLKPMKYFKKKSFRSGKK
jgi:hypothetical protein